MNAIRQTEVPVKKITRSNHRPTTKGWLEATNQIWKLYMALLGFGMALLCFLGAGFSLLFETNMLGPLMVSGTILVVLTFGWLVETLRCPSCQNKLVWTMISSRSHMSWLVELTNLVTCPSCQVPLAKRSSVQWRAI